MLGKLSADLLHDEGSGELMAWRLAGDEWDDAEAVLGGGGGDATVTAGEVADANMRELQCAFLHGPVRRLQLTGIQAAVSAPA